jgi:hypothetical protein
MKCGSITVRRRTAHAPGALVRENAMLDLKTQSQLMDATASIMRAYMRAATETMAASAGRSVSLWAEAMQSSGCGNGQGLYPAGMTFPMSPVGWMAQPWWLGPSAKFWGPLADWGAFGRAPFPGSSAPTKAAPASEKPQGDDAARSGYSAYRSAGGHAVAQVIVPTVEELAELTAKATLSPVQGVLGVWRTALGA